MMSSVAIDYARPVRLGERTFFLLVLAALWGGILAGFVPDSLSHIAGKHVPFAPIVHLHALVYVGWMALLTTQFSLVRSGRVDLHRRLGVSAVVMVPVMLVLGPATSYIMAQREFGTPDADTAFLILPWLAAISFAVIAFTGLANRGNAAIHKRLMLLSTIVLSDAGFARWLAPQLAPLMARTFGPGFIAFHVPEFIGSNLLMAAILGYDVATRGRPYPLVLGATAFAVLLQVITTLVYINPAWTPIATHLIGH
jgi:hypothetical protein